MKFAGGVPSAKLNAPPNSCIPNKANMRMNRKRRNRRDTIERTDPRSDITRLRSDDQYLKKYRHKDVVNSTKINVL